MIRFRDFQNVSLSIVVELRVKLVNPVESGDFHGATDRFMINLAIFISSLSRLVYRDIYFDAGF